MGRIIVTDPRLDYTQPCGYKWLEGWHFTPQTLRNHECNSKCRPERLEHFILTRYRRKAEVLAGKVIRQDTGTDLRTERPKANKRHEEAH